MPLEKVIFYYNFYWKDQARLHSFLNKALISVSIMEISQHFWEGRRIFVAFWHEDVGGGFFGGLFNTFQYSLTF